MSSLMTLAFVVGLIPPLLRDSALAAADGQTPSELTAQSDAQVIYTFTGAPSASRYEPANWQPFGLPRGDVARRVAQGPGLPGGQGRDRAAAGIPPGFEIVQITDDPTVYDYRPKINNRGQFVFTRRFVPGDDLSEEIMLYSRGRLIRLTNDHVRDALPEINDDGTIVWSRGIGPLTRWGVPSLEIMLNEHGQITRLTDNAVDDSSASINHAGQIVWKRLTGDACGLTADIYRYDGQDIVPITTDSLSERVAHQSPQINDLGQIVWTRYNFCPYPWVSDIMMYDNGVTTPLTSGQFAPQIPDINNAGVAAWYYRPSTPAGQAIELWRAGVTTQLTGWGANPHLNNLGDVAFIRWHDNTGNWQQWLHYAGRIWRLSDDPFWNASGDINEHGEVVWQSGNFPWSNIRYMRRIRAANDKAAISTTAVLAPPP